MPKGDAHSGASASTAIGSSERQGSYLERLHREKNGFRFALDFDGERMKDVALLVDMGYGENRSAVIRRAVEEAANNLRRTFCPRPPNED